MAPNTEIKNFELKSSALCFSRIVIVRVSFFFRYVPFEYNTVCMHEPYWKTGGVAEQEGDEQGNAEPWAQIFTLTATG